MPGVTDRPITEGELIEIENRIEDLIPIMFTYRERREEKGKPIPIPLMSLEKFERDIKRLVEIARRSTRP